jgi:adenine-specific DNA-methyltransferase
MNNKNNIYKEYLTTDLHEKDLIVKLDSIQSKNTKDDGVIYTPWEIVTEMILIAQPNPNTKIIEPSCGHGVFIFGLLSYMRSKYGLGGKELLSWLTNKVCGVEISQSSVNDLKESLSYYFKKHFSISVGPEHFTNIVNHDGLTFNSESNVEYDLCIGNPPYIRAKNLEPSYLTFLKENFVSCKKGTIDIYFAFIEKYSNSCEELCFITPNSFLTSNAGATLKNLLSEKIAVLIDFKEKKVFENVGTYTCIFKTVNDNSTSEFFYGTDLNNIDLISRDSFFAEDDKSESGLVDTVLSGVATLYDAGYIVKRGSDEKFYGLYQGIRYEVEQEIVVPYLKITKVKTDELSNIDYMIYPYNDDKTIIAEIEMKEKFPKAYEYLLAMKDKLLQRDNGKTEKYESWYAYGRKQGLHNITEKFIVVVPQMIGGECKPHLINISNLISKFGRIVFTSGFVIPKNNSNKVACEYLLGTSFIDFAKKNGKAWPGKNESYFSLTSKQIKKFKG